MAEVRVQRRLADILAADMASYLRLVAADENRVAGITAPVLKRPFLNGYQHANLATLVPDFSMSAVGGIPVVTDGTG